MISAVRGTRDILPDQVERWQRVEEVARRVCSRYGYYELRTPIIEREELFSKGTGESTDIVQKEMYAFDDKGGQRVTLRPEATPSIVRAFVEHSLEQSLSVAKLFTLGPMFRYERPQKGRYRQFHQLNVEVFGVAEASLDAEVMEMACTFVGELGIDESELVINSVGCPDCRPMFSEALLNALGGDLSKLCGDCQRRAKTNPLRIFDCKVEADQSTINRLPHSTDYLCDACRGHFEAVQQHLRLYDQPFRLSHRLVRGLDYYTRTTFELLSSKLGAQNALLGGGRYDGLVKRLGGPDRPGIGFAAGLERLVLALPDVNDQMAPDVFVAAIGSLAQDAVFVLARALRAGGLRTLVDYEARSAKAQMKRANRAGVSHVVILGDDELATGEVTVKTMATGEQCKVARDKIVDVLLSAS
ncbi:MAG: histidine--tRNA ligase [Vicinamibacterales bacterium]|jgi:histidyl-tRNA synthetase|nr:histidine--tRNA ligase [Acidobacteriota bacterium]MDP7211745.1 histidine--tRNA ligase [Vicinamibacterales bacterium]HJO18008.1 histidine--tRNA ligase [Vicinamibacterales bacterium]|tara:strand:- start:28395 stop:29639 length:1245 start_codon:yes stop_codon:yes gene_type:complete